MAFNSYLQSTQGLVRLVTQLMMAGTQIVYNTYKLQVHMKFLFAGYKDGGMEARRKVHEHLPTRPLQGAVNIHVPSSAQARAELGTWYVHTDMCARPLVVVGAVNYLIRFGDRVVGHQRLRRFLERNPEYHIRKQKQLAAERKQSHSVHDMGDYFEKIERFMREKGITELDVWNMDETGFRIGCGKAQSVVTIDPNKPLHMIDPENRDYITSVECNGSAHPAYVADFRGQHFAQVVSAQ